MAEAEKDTAAAEGEAGHPAVPEAKKPLWTSLEVAKLGISMLTPILIFSLGTLLAYQNKAAEEALRNSSADKEAAAKADATRRDDALRAEGIARDNKIRDEAFERDRMLRGEGYARDQRLRDEAVARENALRGETEHAAKLAALYGKRAEFWEKFRPLLVDVDRAVSMLRPNPKTDENQEILRVAQAKLLEAEDLFEVYAPYFDNGKLRTSLQLYRENLNSLAQLLQVENSPKALDIAQRILKEQYRVVLRFGAEVVAVSTGFQSSNDFR
jgi:hypothetical protein